MTSYVFIRCSEEYFFFFYPGENIFPLQQEDSGKNLCSKTVYRIQTKGFYRRQAVLPRGVNKYIITIIITHIITAAISVDIMSMNSLHRDFFIGKIEFRPIKAVHSKVCGLFFVAGTFFLKNTLLLSF